MTDLGNEATETVEETVTENVPVDEEVLVAFQPKRVNPFCVISKNTFGEYAVRNIETNSAWSSNPYGKAYAIVPDDMVLAIKETNGFVDIVLSEDGTEVVSFEPLEIPEIPVQEPEQTAEQKRITELEKTVAEQEESIYDLTEYQAELLYEVSLMQLGLTE